MPCDRYEYLKFMNEAYIAYKTDMLKYDTYDINDAKGANSDAEISSARAYISRYRKSMTTYLPMMPAQKTSTSCTKRYSNALTY